MPRIQTNPNPAPKKVKVVPSAWKVMDEIFLAANYIAFIDCLQKYHTNPDYQFGVVWQIAEAATKDCQDQTARKTQETSLV